jgi:hypothetical protein
MFEQPLSLTVVTMQSVLQLFRAFQTGVYTLNHCFNEVELPAYVEIKWWRIETSTVSQWDNELATSHLHSDLWTDINGTVFILKNCFTHTCLRQHDTFVALQKVEINSGREKHRNLHRHVSYFVTSTFPSQITQLFVWM